jgi:hypothetical protein
MQSGTSRTASALLNLADADIADLAEQVDLGLLRAVDIDTDAPIPAADLKTMDEHRVRVSLTPPGVSWVCGNPHNKVLYAIERYDRARVPVAHVLDIARVDPADLGVVIDAGLVLLTLDWFGDTVFTRIAQAPTALDAGRSQYFCMLTYAGHRLVEPYRPKARTSRPDCSTG